MASDGFDEHIKNFWQLFPEAISVIPPLHYQNLAMQTQHSCYYLQLLIKIQLQFSDIKFICDIYFFENATFYFRIPNLILVWHDD